MVIDPRLLAVDDCLYRVAVRGLIMNNERLLIVRETEDEWWGIPGGGIDYGEMIETSLLRELEEELGVTKHSVKSDYVIDHYSIGDVVNGVPRMNIYCRVDVAADVIKPTKHVAEWAWVDQHGFMTAALHPSYNKAQLTSIIFTPNTLI